MEWYAPVDSMLTGTERVVVVSGAWSSDTTRYTANSPEGLPVAMYSFTWNSGTPTSTEVWRADYGAFGNIRSTTGTDPLPSPWRFRGQIELPGSAATVWSSGPFTLRDAISLNRWRGYDPHVGQYLSPDLALVLGAMPTFHPYGYSYAGPIDWSDPTGQGPEEWLLTFCAIPANAPVCAALAALLGIALIPPLTFPPGYLPGGRPGPLPNPFGPLPGSHSDPSADGADDGDSGAGADGAAGAGDCTDTGTANPGPERDRCRQVRAGCRTRCLYTLPTGDYGFRFWNCVNDCAAEQGC